MNQPTFGDELRRLRLQRGLSLKKFAQLVHYDSGYLSKIENGLKPPTDAVASRCDTALEADGIPVVIDGRPMLLPIKPDVEFSVAPAGGHDRTSQPDVGEALSRWLPGSSAAIVLGSAGTAWQWELPGGHAFGGASLPAYLGEASWSTEHTAVIADRGSQSLGRFVSSAPRGVIIAASSRESGAAHVLLDVIAARKQIRRSAIAIPQAFRADDVTLGILWALSNMDEALLNDDDVLAQARQCVRDPKLDDSVIPSDAELSAISRMWLGSDSCARFIVSSAHSFSNRPVFWTREQRSEEASSSTNSTTCRRPVEDSPTHQAPLAEHSASRNLRCSTRLPAACLTATRRGIDGIIRHPYTVLSGSSAVPSGRFRSRAGL